MSKYPGILNDVTALLKTLISTPSFSREEENAAAVIRKFLENKNIPFDLRGNNTWIKNKFFDPDRPTILLNSHIDTVKPSGNWTTDPFKSLVTKDMIIGLGSNDAGGALTTIFGAFLHFYESKMPYNLIFAATAEEEISGKDGIYSINDVTSRCAFAIVGEPTGLEMAIAEKGLMVLEGLVKGRSGHAAREEGINAIYLAMEDIYWFSHHNFSKVSVVLGPVKTTVTVIHAGEQHNVIPSECRYTVDVRTTPEYTNEEILGIISDNVHAEITPRSERLQPSALPEGHILEKAANKLGIRRFGSSTLSDQALLSIPSVKIGPGLSERSHTAGEHIYLHELEQGLDTYIALLEEIFSLS